VLDVELAISLSQVWHETEHGVGVQCERSLWQRSQAKERHCTKTGTRHLSVTTQNIGAILTQMNHSLSRSIEQHPDSCIIITCGTVWRHTTVKYSDAKVANWVPQPWT
jgi:hypothetical protein